jgi:hypothetical protein
MKPPLPSLLTLALLATLARADPPTTQPSWADLAKDLGHAGTERDGVYTVTVPRDDLIVATRDTGPIPTAAGMESAFHFWVCPCGNDKLLVVGAFLAADYEANDVIDELRQLPALRVASVAPVLIDDQPKLLSVRFAGEGTRADLAKAIRAALDRTGDARSGKVKTAERIEDRR